MIERASSSDPIVREYLTRHPRASVVEPGASPGVAFTVDGWNREVVAGDDAEELRGLTEMADNNPIVCADRYSVPSPAGTLALIALGPLIDAGLVLEAPSLILSFDANGDDIADWLATAGWNGGVRVRTEAADLGSVMAATAIAAIRTPSEWSEIDDLYEERFGRSFFVRRDETSAWGPELVDGTAFAYYRLRYTPGEGDSLLNVTVLADRNGKAGAAQLVHAMNVMCGFEESLGIA